MSEFLVETYASRETATVGATRVEDIARAADQASQHGTEVRLVRAIFIPEEETCFYLYESSSVEAVREAATRARLPLERITEAVSITPPAHPALEIPNPNQSQDQPTHITKPKEA